MILTGEPQKGFRLVRRPEKSFAVLERDDPVLVAVGDEDRRTHLRDFVDAGKLVAHEPTDWYPREPSAADIRRRSERFHDDDRSMRFADRQIERDRPTH